MRIAMVVPGSGGAFYCQNCARDAVLFDALEKAGCELVTAPMYLPGELEHDRAGSSRDVFFGAVNVYLQEKSPLFRVTPRWLDAVLDAKPILRWAASKAGSTEASSLGAMTLSMLAGRQGRQAKEVRRLAVWLASKKPDVVFLSNALLLGLLEELRERTGAAVVCLLQDEDHWIDSFPGPERDLCWREIARLAGRADALAASSRYYAGLFASRTGLPEGSIRVIPPGIDPDRFPPRGTAPARPALGFLSRFSPPFGLDAAAESYAELRKEPGLEGLRLLASGGAQGAGDEAFLSGIRGRLEAGGAAGGFELLPAFDFEGRKRLFSAVSVFSVPSRLAEAFGMEVLEAVASGVPVVQPRLGAYPEIVEAAGGGLLYEPGDSDELRGLLRDLLLDRAKAAALGAAGREKALELFSGARAAREFLELCESATGNRVKAAARG